MIPKLIGIRKRQEQGATKDVYTISMHLSLRKIYITYLSFLLALFILLACTDLPSFTEAYIALFSTKIKKTLLKYKFSLSLKIIK